MSISSNITHPSVSNLRVKVVAVKDTATNMFGMPITAQHVASVVRSFVGDVNKPPRADGSHQSEFSQNPSDFDLYYLGEFDTTTGQFFPTESGQPERLMRGQDAKQPVH